MVRMYRAPTMDIQEKRCEEATPTTAYDNATLASLVEMLEELGYILVRDGKCQAGQAALIASTALMKSIRTAQA